MIHLDEVEVPADWRAWLFGGVTVSGFGMGDEKYFVVPEVLELFGHE